MAPRLGNDIRIDGAFAFVDVSTPKFQNCVAAIDVGDLSALDSVPGGRWFASDFGGKALYAVRTKQQPDGKKLHRGVRLWSVNVSRAKEDLYRDLQLPVPDLEANQPYPAGFLHFPQYGVEFFEQLCAERQVLRHGSDGFTTRAWEKTRERNEALDCRVYAIAARVIRGIDRWRPEDWAARRKAILGQVRAMKINESHPSEIPKIIQQGHERKVRFRQSQ